MTYILETIITLKSMVQSQNYCTWYLESGAGNLINNEAYFEQKKFVASHELTISLEIRTSSNINYILESLSGRGGGGGSYQLCKFHCSRA